MPYITHVCETCQTETARVETRDEYVTRFTELYAQPIRQHYTDTEGRVHTCYECGEYLCQDRWTGAYEEYCANCCCSDCVHANRTEYDEDGYEEEGIYNYSYVPSLVFRGEGPAFYGIELEIGTENMDATAVYDWAIRNGHRDLFWCKEDGSVEGFEIVTHPMSLDYFESVDWTSFFDMLNKEYPTYDNEECHEHGIHVHVSRDAFTRRSALARFTYLLNKHVGPVSRIARRNMENSSWCRPSRTPVRDVLERIPIPFDIYDAGTEHEYRRTRRITYQARIDGGMTQRYQLTNLTNSATVEVRAFKSTRCPREFASCVHLVAAATEFANMQPSHTTVSDSLSWESFTDFLTTNARFSNDALLIGA